ncbi:glycosyltransferase [Winogradskya humida]|uniref:Glycosyl transferase n=1 Tax=Winogradskya humida TaxID=113566 RepID=A0ABQ3ZYS3_9ACTN|nr:glycosyltransferase [Actinoplanes humidus]GIE23719.1 glycosyl transferase [Actinoplanes humidus]
MTAPVEAPARRTTPTPPFHHLIRLTDDTGLFEHAQHAIARREHGYCTDDVARGLLVVSREPDPAPALLRLAETYLTFLVHAQADDGSFHNRLSFERRWTDRPELGDWWGRALWGLGTAAARHPASWIRDSALRAFTTGAARRSPAPHAMAFAGLGAAEILRADPGNELAATLLADAASAIGWPDPDPAWSWPYPHLSYASAALAEVVIAAGHRRGDVALRAAGLRMLTWLRDAHLADGHLRPLPVTGWTRRTKRQRYDQQPIEIAALADACATAAEVTGDEQWLVTVGQCVQWFLGDNDAGVTMWDRATGGGFDGLTAQGVNVNQGAESTLALIATLQHKRTPRSR